MNIRKIDVEQPDPKWTVYIQSGPDSWRVSKRFVWRIDAIEAVKKAIRNPDTLEVTYLVTNYIGSHEAVVYPGCHPVVWED